MRIVRYFLGIVLGGVLGIVLPAHADEATASKEYLVKAVFLYNFVKYVEWPGDKAIAKTHSATVCIIGDDPFGGALDLIVKQAAATQMMLTIKRDITESQISSCNLLFISKSEAGNLTSLIAHAEHHSVLTVSGIDGFIEKGGIIEMVKVEKNIGLFSKDKINLRINLKEAQEENLQIDAQLLQIAAEVVK